MCTMYADLTDKELKALKQQVRSDVRALCTSFAFLPVWQKKIKPQIDEYLKATSIVRKAGIRHVLEHAFLDYSSHPLSYRPDRAEIFKRYQQQLFAAFDQDLTCSYLL